MVLDFWSTFRPFLLLCFLKPKSFWFQKICTLLLVSSSSFGFLFLLLVSSSFFWFPFSFSSLSLRFFVFFFGEKLKTSLKTFIWMFHLLLFSLQQREQQALFLLIKSFSFSVWIVDWENPPSSSQFSLLSRFFSLSLKIPLFSPSRFLFSLSLCYS